MGLEYPTKLAMESKVVPVAKTTEAVAKSTTMSVEKTTSLRDEAASPMQSNSKHGCWTTDQG